MAHENFVEAVVEEYVKLGHADRVSSNTLRSVKSGNKVRLDTLVEEDSETGVKVFSNGLLISSLRYGERDFADKMLAVMRSELGL